MSDQGLLPVAQYLRMSTNNQSYSIGNQREALHRYANQHGMLIVQTYSDPGISGLELRQRHGLRQLLQDVVASPSYRAIIVYDVSRWGRFQDPDESAHYEFLCKSAGIPVHYCYELFTNDGSVANVLLKQLKRTMAGEYSRELGEKVYAAQKRLVLLGHKMGGTAGFGLRRCVVFPNGRRRVLKPGQYKSSPNEMVRLVPGPKSEVEVVREMFEVVANREVLPGTLAKLLNRRGILNGGGKWTHKTVTELLTNPKYAGTNTWGRTVQRLHCKPRAVPNEQWISKPDAFEPVVDPELFAKVQLRLARRTEHLTDEEALNALRKLWKRKGKLSQRVISMSGLTPSTETYERRFGGLLQAYKLIGYKMQRDCASMIENRHFRGKLRAETIEVLQQANPERIRIVRQYRRRRGLLLVDGSVPCAVIFCPLITTSQGHRRWLFRIRESEKHYPALVCVLDARNESVKMMYLARPHGIACWYTKKQFDKPFQEGILIHDPRQFCSVLLKVFDGKLLPPSVFVPFPPRGH
jgi:DNA invertase Pin-like site-specific DNA recombinase